MYGRYKDLVVNKKLKIKWVHRGIRKVVYNVNENVVDLPP